MGEQEEVGERGEREREGKEGMMMMMMQVTYCCCSCSRQCKIPISDFNNNIHAFNCPETLKNNMEDSVNNKYVYIARK